MKEMRKSFSSFNLSMQQEFQFLKLVSGSESDVQCIICDGKFSVKNGGRARITEHCETKKHIEKSKVLKTVRPINSFLNDDPKVQHL